MAFKKWLLKKEDTAINEISSKSKINLNKTKLNKFILKAIVSIQGISDERERFQRPEYNLWEIKEASESDSYIKIAFSKLRMVLRMSGWH